MLCVFFFSFIITAYQKKLREKDEMCWRFKLLPFFLDDEMKNGSKDFTRKMEIGPPLRFVCLSAQIFLPPPPPPPPHPPIKNGF